MFVDGKSATAMAIECGNCRAAGPLADSGDMAAGLWNRAKRKIDNRRKLTRLNVSLKLVEKKNEDAS
jgi:hypothetical protein